MPHTMSWTDFLFMWWLAAVFVAIYYWGYLRSVHGCFADDSGVRQPGITTRLTHNARAWWWWWCVAA